MIEPDDRKPRQPSRARLYEALLLVAALVALYFLSHG